MLLGLRPSDLGMSARGNPYPAQVKPIWPVYLMLLLGTLPFVQRASALPSFRRRYPFPAGMIGPDGTVTLFSFLLLQSAYFGVFVSGESFWRGFLCFGLERDLGAYGILLMVVPYVCSHYGKPMLEAMGATGSGIVLGWLALKHRSIWYGVAVHYIVALSMDLLAMRARGFSIVL